jgi:hypothetical protein
MIYRENNIKYKSSILSVLVERGCLLSQITMDKNVYLSREPLRLYLKDVEIGIIVKQLKLNRLNNSKHSSKITS